MRAAAAIVAGTVVGACSFEARPNTGDVGPDASGAEGTGQDAAVGDACYGPAGDWQVCLGEPPTMAVVLPPAIDTSTSDLCLIVQPARWSPAQPASCFIVGATISVPGTTVVTGLRPLVLVAADAISVDGVPDVASHVGGSVGPGSPGAPCAAGSPAKSGAAGGGGAGGSLQSKGGDGGKGDDNSIDGGEAGSERSSFPSLRAGCPGKPGGRMGGAPGAGGGAVYLVAGTAIRGTGTINASGAGAVGAGDRSGGSGAGSGGMIVLHAAAIQVGTLIANGGGGAGGGSQANAGGSGKDPSAANVPAPGGPGADNAGSGGAGQTGIVDGKNGGGTKDHAQVGGGGGGGGAGYIQANLVVPASPTISPPVVRVP